MDILVIDQHELVNQEYCHFLENLGHTYSCVGDTESAIEKCMSQAFDLFIINQDQFQGGMANLVLQLRSNCYDLTDWTPIIVVSESEADDILLEAIDAGGDDFLKKPIKQTILEAKIKSLRRIITMRENLMDFDDQLKLINDKLFSSTEAIKDLILRDPLTLIANRRAFQDYYQQMLKACTRKGDPLTLIMADVDYFKAYNDHYGHQEADQCLVRVAQTLSSHLHRPSDFIARFGGEVFAILLPETPLLDAGLVCERLRIAVQDIEMQHSESPLGFVTLSFGFAQAFPHVEFNGQSLIDAANNALDKAKHHQRNTIFYCTEVLGKQSSADKLPFNQFSA